MLSDIENIFRSVGMSLDKDKVKKIIGIKHSGKNQKAVIHL